jgi:hypothetical protein
MDERERERERVIRGERVMWERAVARQSTLSKRIDENLFAFWIKLPPAASGFGGRHPRFSSAFTPPRAEILDRCDPRTLDVSRKT